MKHSRAFTLIEMIVAIAIFAVIATISYASLNRYLDYRDVVEQELHYQRSLQQAFSMLERDMRFMTERVVRDEYGDPEALLIINNEDVAGELARFTGARRNVSVPGISALQRIAYRWENDTLVRISWKVLDREQEAEESRHQLLTGVSNVSVSTLQNSAGILSPYSSWEQLDRLPDGMEWLITMADGRQYRRIFEVKHVPPR
jgi:general secretion pathway protein J